MMCIGCSLCCPLNINGLIFALYIFLDYLCREVVDGSRCYHVNIWFHCFLLRHTWWRKVLRYINCKHNCVLGFHSCRRSYPSSHVKLSTLLNGTSVLPFANGCRGLGIWHILARKICHNMDSSEYSVVTEYYKLQDIKAVIADCV